MEFEIQGEMDSLKKIIRDYKNLTENEKKRRKTSMDDLLKELEEDNSK